MVSSSDLDNRCDIKVLKAWASDASDGAGWKSIIGPSRSPAAVACAATLVLCVEVRAEIEAALIEDLETSRLIALARRAARSFAAHVVMSPPPHVLLVHADRMRYCAAPAHFESWHTESCWKNWKSPKIR
eukprot:CAMPEP_0204408770 /NCGR_PEP_ID=MMETSP0470-20130426/9676_1 /ASSEMBLY_ACC=CAM_ASM_000385 /TAXON_ID=2969 /ORGANISM="Oxyrrhis marina" /LENGTH=129 /DNA_ID=CAMNT_0051404569 /DNA_START=764 /DNA_END=1151 /DNA_ORIENTATION=-